MITEADKERVEKGFKIVLITWAAIFACLLVYLVIAHVAGENIRQGSGSQVPIPLFRNILICVSVAEIFIIHLIRKLMLSKSTAYKLDESNIPPGQIPVVFQYLKVTVISAAVAESIGIYGLVLYFIGASLTTLYLFIAASALAMLYYRPRKEELVNLAIEYEMGLAQKSSLH